MEMKRYNSRGEEIRNKKIISEKPILEKFCHKKPFQEALPLGHKIKGKYKIEGYLSESNFSNIYYVSLENEYYVAKECFPKEIVCREGDKVYYGKNKGNFKTAINNFKKEGEILEELSLRGENRIEGVAKMKEYLEYRGTSYIIMEYCKGSILKDYILENTLKEREILEIFIKILKIVEKIHEKEIIHRDIKPSNIIINIENNVKIIDFGSSILKKEKNGNIINTTSGYSPLEMYSLKTEINEKSDLYSLCGVLYFMLDKKNPLEAVKRFYNPEISFNRGVKDEIRDIVIKGMSMEMEKRFECVWELKRRVEAVVETITR